MSCYRSVHVYSYDPFLAHTPSALPSPAKGGSFRKTEPLPVSFTLKSAASKRVANVSEALNRYLASQSLNFNSNRSVKLD